MCPELSARETIQEQALTKSLDQTVQFSIASTKLVDQMQLDPWAISLGQNLMSYGLCFQIMPVHIIVHIGMSV